MKNDKQIIIYKDKRGKSKIEVKLEEDSVWLTQKQMSQLFKKNVRTINEHILNIFKEKELDKKSVIRKSRITASDGKKYQSMVYNLDVIISVGYRVKSLEGTKFRIWATNTLRKYLVDGYLVNEKKLLEEKKKFSELQDAINFINKHADNYLLQGKTRELLSLIGDYSETLSLLKQYDSGDIKLIDITKPSFKLSYKKCKEIIGNIKIELKAKKEASDLFGMEVENKLKSIIGVIYQTSSKKELYKSVEEKAANLLYLTIKDHPFSDGNKRIASILFVYFLRMNGILYKSGKLRISNNTLVSLALLVATSDPKDKRILIKMIMSLI